MENREGDRLRESYRESVEIFKSVSPVISLEQLPVMLPPLLLIAVVFQMAENTPNLMNLYFSIVSSSCNISGPLTTHAPTACMALTPRLVHQFRVEVGACST